MKTRLLLFLIPACLLLSGCPSFSSHPLYTEHDAVVEPALEGKWNAGPDDNVEFLFQKAGEHEYSLAISCPDTKVSQNYEVHLVRLGGQLFMDLIFKDQTVDGTKLDNPIGVVPEHVIVKVRISGDDLAYATLEDDAIRNQGITESAPLDYQMADGPLLVTGQTDALQRYISAHTEDAFSDFEHLKRTGETSIQR